MAGHGRPRRASCGLACRSGKTPMPAATPARSLRVEEKLQYQMTPLPRHPAGVLPSASQSCAAPRIQPRPAPGAGAGRMRGCASLTRPVWCTVTARVVLMRAGTSDGREVRVCNVLPCVSVCVPDAPFRCHSWIARVSGIGCLFGSGVRIATSCSWMAMCTPHLRLSPPLAASLTDLLAPLAF